MILVAFLQEADIIILHEMFENVWNHTIEEILVEFSLRGAVVVFSEHGEESLMKLPMHSYDLSGRCVDGRIIGEYDFSYSLRYIG